MQGLLDLAETHAIVEDTIEDRLADLVIVVGLGRDAFPRGAEGGAAVAGGPVFGGGDMNNEDGLVGDGANAAFVEVPASAELSALRAGGLLGCVPSVGVQDLGSRHVVGGLGMVKAYNSHGMNSWQDGS